MVIRKGVLQDLNEIIKIIEAATIDMNSKEIYQWDEIYPNKEVLIQDIEEGNLYVSQTEYSYIQGIIVLNEDQGEEYYALNWKYKTETPLVIHRLCIHPSYQGKGIAKILVKYGEEYGKEKGYDAIRLDAFIQNYSACNLYEGLGYRKVGIVTFRKGDFYCYEKLLVNDVV